MGAHSIFLRGGGCYDAALRSQSSYISINRLSATAEGYRNISGTSQVLLAGGQVLFGESLVLTWLKMSEIILTGHKTQI